MGDRKRIGSLFCLPTNRARNRTAIRTHIRTRVDGPLDGFLLTNFIKVAAVWWQISGSKFSWEAKLPFLKWTLPQKIHYGITEILIFPNKSSLKIHLISQSVSDSSAAPTSTTSAAVTCTRGASTGSSSQRWRPPLSPPKS
jgi:hypothetical protein